MEAQGGRSEGGLAKRGRGSHTKSLQAPLPLPSDVSILLTRWDAALQTSAAEASFRIDISYRK